MTTRSRKPLTRRPAPHRTATPSLDPYMVQGTTLTLQEWRQTRGVVEPVHHVLFHTPPDERIVA